MIEFFEKEFNMAAYQKLDKDLGWIMNDEGMDIFLHFIAKKRKQNWFHYKSHQDDQDPNIYVLNFRRKSNVIIVPYHPKAPTKPQNIKTWTKCEKQQGFCLI